MENNNTSLILARFGISSELANYSQTANAFLSTGYISMAGNTYFCALRFAGGVVIKEDVGQGYARTFLNGLKIYSANDKVLLADRSYNCCFYDRGYIEYEIQDMLMDVLNKAAKNENLIYDKNIAQEEISKIAKQAVYENQLQNLHSQTARLLNR